MSRVKQGTLTLQEYLVPILCKCTLFYNNNSILLSFLFNRSPCMLVLLSLILISYWLNKKCHDYTTIIQIVNEYRVATILFLFLS